MQAWRRILRHLATGRSDLARALPSHALSAIEKAIQDCEGRHAGEIRFAVEASLTLPQLWRGMEPRERAIEVFSQLRVWDTAHNNGVLVYLLLADRDVEIVADRGVAGGSVKQAEWYACTELMEQHFRRDHFRDGVTAGIAAVAEVLQRHAPGSIGSDAGNELPDRPAIL